MTSPHPAQLGMASRTPLRAQATGLSLLRPLCIVAALLVSLYPVALAASPASFEPLSTSAPPFTSVTHPLPLSSHWDPALLARVGAVPTNKWWQNIALEPSDQPVMINPISMRIDAGVTDKGVTSKRGGNFGLPTRVANVEMVSTPFMPGFAFSAVETLQPHVITAFDSLSVTIKFTEEGKERADADAPSMQLPLVRGMPYATALYHDMTPYLYTNNAIMSCNAQDLPGVVRGNSLRLTMNNEQTVLVYAWRRHSNSAGDDEELEWQWDRNTVQLKGPAGTTDGKGDWVVRMAFVPHAGQADATSASSVQEVYDKYHTTVPTGGEWTYEFTGEGTDSSMLHTSITFTTETKPTPNSSKVAQRLLRQLSASSSSSGPSPLLMLSLPHHQATLHPSTTSFVPALEVVSLKGSMLGVEGATWSMSTPAAAATKLGFRAPREVDPSRLEALKAQLLQDIESSVLASEPDPYGFGKAISKVGRLALMADEVGLGSEVVTPLVELMKGYLAPWLQGSNPNALRYDSTYGGIVSSNGLADAGADFGQAYYNDHHFHYGYILYGAAVLAHFDPAWGVSNRDSLLALARDYANPALDGLGSSSSDAYFTRLRHFDIFDSHSWASGLFVFSDGRNQESSSESINGYYALALLGQALDLPELARIGQALMTLEVVGTKTYWHSTNDKSVYPKVYADNKSNKAVDATWFAAGKVYIHGINMLPFTPASELYLTPDWVAESYPVVSASVTPDITDEWKGFLYGTRCVIDSEAAWEQIQGLKSFDGGNTRSNLMYFCATRPMQPKQQAVRRHQHEETSTADLVQQE